MPAISKKQKKFFLLVKGVQQGRISPKRVSSKITKTANSMSPRDVDDFTKGENIPKKKLQEMAKFLRNLVGTPETDSRVDLQYNINGTSMSGISPVEPMYLQENEEGEENTNPVAKTFTQKGNLEQYIQRFSGLEMKPKEIESITNHTDSKPSKQDKFHVRYEEADEFGTNTVSVIKKLREGNDLVFTVFQSNVPQNQTPEQPNENEIVVSKSKAFRNEIEGGKILADILQKLEI